MTLPWRHGPACPGHPRLTRGGSKAWMARMNRAMTRSRVRSNRGRVLGQGGELGHGGVLGRGVLLAILALGAASWLVVWGAGVLLPDAFALPWLGEVTWLDDALGWALIPAALLLSGEPEAARDLVLWAADACEADPDLPYASTTAQLLVFLEQWERARAMLERATERARTASALWSLAYDVLALAGLEHRSGRLRAAYALAEESVRLAEDVRLGPGCVLSGATQLGRGVSVWDGLEAVEDAYDIEAVSSPSGVTHLTFTLKAAR